MTEGRVIQEYRKIKNALFYKYLFYCKQIDPNILLVNICMFYGQFVDYLSIKEADNSGQILTNIN